MERLGKGLLSALSNSDCSYVLFNQTNRTRESSVAISPQWTMLEEIEFHRLAKLKLEVDEPENM
jgi:hypothetical protein